MQLINIPPVKDFTGSTTDLQKLNRIMNFISHLGNVPQEEVGKGTFPWEFTWFLHHTLY